MHAKQYIFKMKIYKYCIIYVIMLSMIGCSENIQTIDTTNLVTNEYIDVVGEKLIIDEFNNLVNDYENTLSEGILILNSHNMTAGTKKKTIKKRKTIKKKKTTKKRK